ncbi:type 1 glutamine amidotransferase family protein [Marinobacter gelidimuriae]|uniref:hypothetical protein n=1 Tax=Marinobacter gelidimuriae TaxID=2739064 RepID=UPI000362BB0D|nr:hypothetical protein [Marinobacter gelidimuriae]
MDKYSEGWGAGLHHYELLPGVSAVKPNSNEFTLSAMHQDQVVVKPDQANVLAFSAFCPFAALQYDNRILTFQAHPEFDVTFETRLVRHLRGQSLPESNADQALDELGAPAATTDSRAIAGWMARFVLRNQENF